MSNPFKAVGKVFKKVVKVAKKIAIPALMIGAVVLTGGAALGALPALGTILGSVGISGTLASVLGGAISMGAVGALSGGLIGAATGGGLLKGATKGFLMGAATGGVMGGVGAIGANGVLGGLGGSAASTAATGSDLVVNNAANAAGVANAFNPLGTVGAAVPTSITTSATTAATAAGAAQAAGGGILGSAGIGPLIQGAGQIISGFAAGKGTQAQIEAEAAQQRDKYDRAAYNYGYRNIYGDDDSDIPTDQQQWYQYHEPNFLTPSSGNPGGLLRTQPSPLMQPAVRYQIVNGQVVPVGG